MQIKISISIVFTLILLFGLFADTPNFGFERLRLAMWSLGHLVAFGFWTYLVFIFQPRYLKLTVYKQLGIVVAICLGFGGLIELIQPYFDRHGEWSDLLSNFSGGIIAWLSLKHSEISKKVMRYLRAVTAILFAFYLLPKAELAIDEYWLAARFPIIAEFKQPTEILRWRNNQAHSIAIMEKQFLDQPAANVLAIHFKKNRFSGASLRFFKRDWRDFQHIKFEIYNPNQDSVELTAIFTDKAHYARKHQPRSDDRFNQKWLLLPGKNQLIINLSDIQKGPKDRTLNLSNMSAIYLNAYKVEQPFWLYVQNIALFD